MPSILTSILWKIIVPVAIKLLERSGAVNKAEALAAKTYTVLRNELSEIETYAEYDKPAEEKLSKSVQTWRK